VTHFLADYALQAGGWVKVLAGQYCQYAVVTNDPWQPGAARSRKNAHMSASSLPAISTCSLEVWCRLAAIGEGQQAQQPIISCSRVLPSPRPPSSGAGGPARGVGLDGGDGEADTTQEAAKWARCEPPLPLIQ
jgi:hypothetical protein